GAEDRQTLGRLEQGGQHRNSAHLALQHSPSFSDIHLPNGRNLGADRYRHVVIYTTAPISQRNLRYEHILSTPRRLLLMKSDMQIRRLGHLLAAELRASKMSYDRPCAEASTSAHKT